MSQHVRPSQLALLLTLLAWLRLPVPALAASELAAPGTELRSSNRERAREHYARGLERYSRRDYSGALRELELAHALAPSPKLLFAMGQAYAGEKRYADAIITLQGYLEGAGAAVPPERRARVQRQLQAFRELVGRLIVSSSAPGTVIRIDGKDMGQAPLLAPVPLVPGVHHVTAAHAGSPPRTTRIEVAPGGITSVRFDWPRQQPGAGVELATPLWIASGVLAALTLGSAAFSFDRQRDYERSLEQPSGSDPASSSRALRRQRSEVASWLLATDILAGLTVLSAGSALYFSVTPLRGAELEPTAGQGASAPLAVVGGSF